MIILLMVKRLKTKKTRNEEIKTGKEKRENRKKRTKEIDIKKRPRITVIEIGGTTVNQCFLKDNINFSSGRFRNFSTLTLSSACFRKIFILIAPTSYKLFLAMSVRDISLVL